MSMLPGALVVLLLWTSASGTTNAPRMATPAPPGTAEELARWSPVIQAAVAAGFSWLVAVNVVGHRSPFFAPIAAVIRLGMTLGERLRRGIELVASESEMC